MANRIPFSVVFALVAIGGVTTLAPAQADKKPEDKLVYVLTKTAVLPRNDDPEQRVIEVVFGASFPKAYIDAGRALAKPLDLQASANQGEPSDWTVHTTALEPIKEQAVFGPTHPTNNVIEAVGASAYLRPEKILVPPPQYKLVYLVMKRDALIKARLNPETHKIVIRYNQGNFPEVTLGEPKKVGTRAAYDAAKGKDDADIYFSGKAVGAKGSKPEYSFESKVGYLQGLGRAGAIGASATMNADKESNADPDSITAAATYEKIFTFQPATGILFRSSFIGGEFDRKGKTRNLLSAAEAKFVIPSAKFGENILGTMDFLLGFEGGNNYKNPLVERGIGAFWRWKVGAAAYLLASRTPIFKGIHVNCEWRLRLPTSAEVFSEKIPGIKDPVLSLTKKPRHHVGIDADFMFSKSLGLTAQYRWGSLPPTFNMVDHKVTGGIVLKLAQANK